MTQYFRDFADADGISDWTGDRYATTVSWSVSSGNLSGGTTNALEALTWNDIDGDANRANIDVYGEFETNNSAQLSRNLCLVRGNTATTSTNSQYYQLGLRNTTLRATYKVDGGSLTTITDPSSGLTVAADTRYKYRFRVQTDGSTNRIYGRVWLASDSEPTTWQIDGASVTDNNITTAGVVGVQRSSATHTHLWHDFGVGTNGDSAPVAASGGATLTPSLYTNTQTFYSPTVSTGAVTLTPSLYTNTNTFYSATVEQGGATQDLTPSLYTNTNIFYGPVVTTANALTPSLYTNTNSFYNATVSTSNTLTPSPYTNSNTFYTHLIEVEGGAQNVLPNLYTNTNTFYSTTVSVGSVSLTPALYTNTNSFFAASITTNNTLVAPFIVNTSSFFTHEVTQGAAAAQDLQPSLFTNNNVFFVHMLSGGESVALGAGSSKREKKTKQYLVDGVLRELTDEQVAQLMYDAAQQPKKIVLEDKPEPLDVPEELKKKSIFRPENLEKPKKTKPVFAKEVIQVKPEHVVVEQVDNEDESFIMQWLERDAEDRRLLAKQLQQLYVTLSGRR